MRSRLALFSVLSTLCPHIEGIDGSVILSFGLGGQHVADRLEQAVVIEPVDPFEGGILGCLEAAPRNAPIGSVWTPIDRTGR